MMIDTRDLWLQTVDGLLGLPQPVEQRSEWQRAWDELSDLRLEVQEASASCRLRNDCVMDHYAANTQTCFTA